MDTASLVEIISEKFIKPSSPTPLSLRSYKLSYQDQLMPNIYSPMGFFYPSIQGSDWFPASQLTELLQSSLSKTLTYYYPFAGRLTNNLFIDCNDTGVRFIEARMKCRIHEIIRQPNSQLEYLVFPAVSQTFSRMNILANSSLVLVQLNYFDCGSLAVGMLVSHKIADASTIATFINDWATMARSLMSSDDHFPSPQFIGASIFPPVEDLAGRIRSNWESKSNWKSCVTRRFLFQASRIEKLKAMAANSGVDNPSGVEVVTALLYKCAISASMAANSGSVRPPLLLNAANLRPITIPPLPQNSVGNFVTIYPILVNKSDKVKFPELVSKLRDGKITFQNKYKEKQKFDNEDISTTSAFWEDIIKKFNVYQCSSICKFGFYDVDFGWGRPSLVRFTTKLGPRNTFVLMDLKSGDGDGIQAVVTLEKQDMCLFEANEELQAFASSNGENERPYVHGNYLNRTDLRSHL